MNPIYKLISLISNFLPKIGNFISFIKRYYYILLFNNKINDDIIIKYII